MPSARDSSGSTKRASSSDRGRGAVNVSPVKMESRRLWSASAMRLERIEECDGLANADGNGNCARPGLRARRSRRRIPRHFEI